MAKRTNKTKKGSVIQLPFFAGLGFGSPTAGQSSRFFSPQDFKSDTFPESEVRFQIAHSSMKVTAAMRHDSTSHGKPPLETKVRDFSVVCFSELKISEKARRALLACHAPSWRVANQKGRKKKGEFFFDKGHTSRFDRRQLQFLNLDFRRVRPRSAQKHREA